MFFYRPVHIHYLKAQNFCSACPCPAEEIENTTLCVSVVAQCCATNRKVACSIPAGVNGFFIDIKPFRSHYGPGVDSASNRSEYQVYFLG